MGGPGTVLNAVAFERREVGGGRSELGFGHYGIVVAIGWDRLVQGRTEEAFAEFVGETFPKIVIGNRHARRAESKAVGAFWGGYNLFDGTPQEAGWQVA